MTALTIPEARKLLKTYSCIQTRTVESDVEKEQLRQALLLLTQASDYENLGICADSAEQGFTALTSYLKAMGYETALENVNLTEAPAPIYIKFNTQKLAHYCDRYVGEYRGVLVSCQSEDDEVNGTYGHLPLDLFEN
ncbi:MAG: DUF1824 family protein [Cyanobacteriota bacterium]|nr:DUF1824 family protein [Cyanobacteriota bacterium]